MADSYNNAGIFYDNQGNQEKAEYYYKKAIEIREELAESNPERFNPDLATSYYNAGTFYYNQGNKEKAEYYCKKAIEIYEELALNNPYRFNPDLAVSYITYALFTDDNQYYGKSYQIAKQYPEHPHCKKIIEYLTP